MWMYFDAKGIFGLNWPQLDNARHKQKDIGYLDEKKQEILESHTNTNEVLQSVFVGRNMLQHEKKGTFSFWPSN